MPVSIACKNTITKTDKEIFEDEKLTAEYDPMFIVKGEFLSIKTKDGRLIKLKLNEPQKKLLVKIEEQIKLNKPIRIWVLKARQEGVSTEIEAIIYAFTSQRENTNSLIMADEKEHASNLFEMSKLYHEQLEITDPHLAPALKKSNEKKLEFEKIHSQIIIATAENIDAARSHTFKIAHLSEVSRFRDLNAVMSALNQSVSESSETMIIGETTANGMEAFYEEWIRAVEGKTAWIPVFIAWFMLSEYSMPLQNGLYPVEGIKFDADYSEQEFLREEQELKKEFTLTDEQLNFRRYAIVNKCGGSIRVFDQEFPSTWQKAFQVSGSHYFDKALEKQDTVRPIETGEIFELNMNYEFRNIPEGRIKLYEKPSKDEQYIETLDASEALGLDEASIIVLNKRTNVTVAEVSGQYTPEELAHLGIMLGNYFNKALIAPENKGYGYMVCQLIYQKYGNIYKRMRTKTGEKEETEELGFNTNSVTRPQYLAQLNEEIRLRSTQLKSKKLIDQCRTFIINPKTKKAEATSGKQDGLVICRGIAGIVRQEHPYKVTNTTQHHFKQKSLITERSKKRGF